MGRQSFWELKPWWCQPWTILLTGILVIGASWLIPASLGLIHWWWVTLPVALLVLLWWGLFLVLVPAGYTAEGREQP